MIKNPRSWQAIFYRAIIDGDSLNMLKALENGAMINKNQNKNNTINCAIRSMLNQSIEDTFNLKFIEDLLDAGATIYSNDRDDIIKRKGQHICKACYYKRDKDAEKNIKDLIQLLIKRGAKSNNTEILDDVVRLQDNDLIDLIIRSGVLPGPLTFTVAAMTRNFKILNFMYDYGARPDNNYKFNTLAAVLETHYMDHHWLCGRIDKNIEQLILFKNI
jgi:hypothetical protein